MGKKKGLPFMRMDEMTGRYFVAEKPKETARLLRKKFPDIKFVAVPSVLPGTVAGKVLACRKDGKNITEPMMVNIYTAITKIQEEE